MHLGAVVFVSAFRTADGFRSLVGFSVSDPIGIYTVVSPQDAVGRAA